MRIFKPLDLMAFVLTVFVQNLRMSSRGERAEGGRAMFRKRNRSTGAGTELVAGGCRYSSGRLGRYPDSRGEPASGTTIGIAPGVGRYRCAKPGAFVGANPSGRLVEDLSEWLVTRQEPASQKINVWRRTTKAHTPGSTAESTISGRVIATAVWPHWGENRIADSHIEIRPGVRLRSFDSAEIPRPCVRCTSASLGSICAPGRPAFERAACLDRASGY